MAEEEIIPIDIICSYYEVEPSFLDSLESHGLISISFQNNQKFILKEDIAELEKFSRMYYELQINVPGIDALSNMLEKIRQLQKETEFLKSRLRIYE